MVNKINKYEQLIKYREHIEKDFQKECDRMRDLLLSEESKLSNLEIAQENSVMELQERQESEISLHEATVYYSFLNNITYEIDKQIGVLEDIKEQFELKRNALLLAHRNRKIAEKLKDKEVEKISVEFEREEQKFLDDISEKKHWRKKRNAS